MLNAPTLCGVGAILLWAFLALCATQLARLPPVQITALGFTVAAVLSTTIVAARRRLAQLRQPPRAWALGLCGLAGYHVVYFAAFAAAPAVEVNLVTYLWPLLIVLFSAPLLGTRLTLPHLAGALMAFTGCLLAIGGAARFDPAHAFGYALGLCAAVIWSLYSVLSRRLAEVPSDAVAGFCAGTALVTFVLHIGIETWVTPSPTEWIVLLALGAGPLGAAFFLWDVGMKRGDVRLIGTLAYATPVLSTLVLMLSGVTPFAWTIVLAALLVAGGGLLAAR
jgi:drug/metabolite transporter (DMT)-like permease